MVTGSRAPMLRMIIATGALALGCGARSGLEPLPERRPGRSDSTTPSAATTTSPSQPSTNGSTQGGQGNLPFPDSELGECVEGVPRAAAASCAFVARGRCYPDALSACACICPRDQGATVCAESLFPDRGGATPVNCFLR